MRALMHHEGEVKSALEGSQSDQEPRSIPSFKRIDRVNLEVL